MGCHSVCNGLLVFVLACCTTGRAENACRLDAGLSSGEKRGAPRGGLSLEATLTQDGGTAISFRELLTNKGIPQDAWRLYRRAIKADHKGEFQAAEDLTASALKEAPEFFQAHAGLAVLRLRQGLFDSAEEEILTALRLDPQYLPGEELMGIAAFLEGNTQVARRILASVVSRDPGRGSAHYFLGRTLCATGHGRRAEEEFEIAKRLRKHPVPPDLFEEFVDVEDRRLTY